MDGYGTKGVGVEIRVMSNFSFFEVPSLVYPGVTRDKPANFPRPLSCVELLCSLHPPILILLNLSLSASKSQFILFRSSSACDSD